LIDFIKRLIRDGLIASPQPTFVLAFSAEDAEPGIAENVSSAF
jgi:hypothetical protein